MSIETFNIEDTRNRLLEVYNNVNALNAKLQEDHKAENICVGFAEYKKELPGKFLERASGHLSKKGYFVGVAGVFSAGKSTMINALLREPGMLPTAIHSCTYSLTRIGGAGTGEEHLEIKYYSKDDSLKYLLDNPRYGPLLEKRREEYMTNFTADKALRILKETLEALKSDPLPENQTKKRELDEYVDYLTRYADRLGTVYIDNDITRENMKRYLTTDENNKGHGHLLLIEEVSIFKRNQLFVEKGISLCDLPGTGALNPRDTEVALRALRDADLIIMAIPPQGFAADNVMLKKELEQYNNEIKNKIFFVINRWDEILEDEMSQAVKLNEMMKEHIVAPIVSMGLNPDRIYLTNSKLVEDTLRGDRIDEAHRKALDGMREKSKRLMSLIPSGIDKDLAEKMRVVYSDGGIDRLRVDLLHYLEREIAIERLKEIFSNLARVYSASKRLLDPERPRIEGMKAAQMNHLRQVNEFVQQTVEKFSDHVRNIEEGLKGASGKLLDSAKEKVGKEVDGMIKGMNFGRIRAKLQIPAPNRIKAEAISLLKEKLADRFSEIIQQHTVRPISDAVSKTLEEAKIEKILEALAASLDRNFADEYKKTVAEFSLEINELTRMRAREETWAILDADIRPTGFEPEWTQAIEKEFRGQLLAIFSNAFASYADKLKSILWRYYKGILDVLIEKFESLMAELTDALKGVENISLPVDLLGGEGEDYEERKKAYKILEYFRLFNPIEKTMADLTTRFAAVGVK